MWDKCPVCFSRTIQVDDGIIRCGDCDRSCTWDGRWLLGKRGLIRLTSKKRKRLYVDLVDKLTAKHHPPRSDRTREHEIPKQTGYNRRYPAHIVGGRENVNYTSIDDNVTKFTRISDKGHHLIKKHNL